MWASVELALENREARQERESGLVASAQDGDRAAFGQLYRGNVDHVYAVCLRIAANVSRAEELTQRTFIRAWEMLKSFRGESAFSSWLHRIAVNVVLADVRSERRRMARIEFDDDVDNFDNPED